MRRLQISVLVAATAAILAALGMTAAHAGTDPAATVSPAPPSASPSVPDTSPSPPGAPTNLAATKATSGSVTLTWTAPAPGCCGVSGYDILYYQAFNDIVWVQSVDNVTTAVVSANIRPITEYHFSVSAKDSLGHRSSSSNAVAVMTPVADTGDTTPPPAPSALTATVATGGTWQLSWTAPADTSDVAGYNVYAFDSLASTLLGATTGTTFTAPLPSGPLPQFYVRSRDAAGNLSLASNLVRVSPTSPGKPNCRVTYVNNSAWPHGFVATITIANTGSTAINGWTLSFSFGGDQQIGQVWGVKVTQVGRLVTMQPLDWDATIQAGASLSFGLQGTWTTSNAPPTTFTLNGVRCAT